MRVDAAERELRRQPSTETGSVLEAKREIADFEARNAKLTRAALAASSKAHVQLMETQDDRLAFAARGSQSAGRTQGRARLP